MIGTADTYGLQWQHNWRLYSRPGDAKLIALPWDFDRSMEFALGDNALPAITAVNGDGSLTVTIPHRTGADCPIVTIRSSTDLVTWISESTATAAADGITWTLPPPAAGAPTRRFLSVQLSVP